MRHDRVALFALAAGVVSLLAACGGGGGSSAPTSSPGNPPPPVSPPPPASPPPPPSPPPVSPPPPGPVLTAPVIVQPPASMTAVEGTSVELSVTATGSPPLSYEWQKNGAVIAGATESRLRFTAALADNGALYGVRVSNPAGSVSSAGAKIEVVPAAASLITRSPINTATASGRASFEVFAVATAGIRYQWQQAPASSGTFTDIAGATSRTLALEGITPAQHGTRYRVVVSDGAGRSMPSATATLGVMAPPSPNCRLPQQGGWCWANPGTSGNQINSVAFANGQTGWKATALGEILKTTDGGRSWQLQLVDRSRYMRNLVAQDEQTAWFTADGLVFATSNGGASWTARALLPGVIIDLRRVGTNDLWAVGTEGGIWRSRDGGLTWTTQASGVTQSLFSIDSVDGVTAWAVGLSGTTLKTTNGGLNWAPQRVLPPGSEELLSQVDMVDAQTIWLVRSGGAVLVSNNGGLTWTTREHRKNVYRLVALDGTRAVASGFGAMVTNDGGQTWTPGFDLGVNSFTSAIHAAPDASLWVAGSGIVARSGDRGQTWVSHLPGPAAQLYGVAASAAGLVAVGIDGVIVRAESFGGAWTRVPAVSTEPLLHVTMRNNVAWAVGFSGSILRSSDGGRSWLSVSNADAHLTFRGVASTDDSTAWVVGDAGAIYKTTDAGATWVRQQSGTTQTLNAITAVSPTVLFAVGRAGTILRTQDGGTTWLALASATSVELNTIAAANPERVWAAGQGGIVVLTSNGGQSWTSVLTSGARLNLRGIAAASADVLFSAATDGGDFAFSGDLLKSTDGGLTWRSTPNVAANASFGGTPMSGVVALDSQRAVVVGASGAILTTTTGGE